MEATCICPYCGECVELCIDVGGGATQRYVEDCPVCCRPWDVVVVEDASGDPEVTLARQDE